MYERVAHNHNLSIHSSLSITTANVQSRVYLSHGHNRGVGGGTALRPFEVVRMTKTWRRKRKPDRSIETGAVQIQKEPGCRKLPLPVPLTPLIPVTSDKAQPSYSFHTPLLPRRTVSHSQSTTVLQLVAQTRSRRGGILTQYDMERYATPRSGLTRSTEL